MHRLTSGKECRASAPFLTESASITLPAHLCVHHPGSSAEFYGPDILLGFHYRSATDWLMGHMIEISLQPSPPSVEVRQQKVPPALSSQSWSSWCPALSRKPSPSRELPRERNRDTPVIQEMLRVVHAPCQKRGTKTRQVLYYTTVI